MELNVVELPYLYHVRFIPPGAQKARTAVAKGFASFSVPHVSSDEAPLATEWRQVDAAERYKADVPVVRTRTFQNRAYVALAEGKNVGDVVADLRSGRRIRWGYSELPPLPIVAKPHAFSDDTSPTRYMTEAELFAHEVASATRGNAVRKVDDDASARLAEASETWRRGLLVVDGEVWASRPDREPQYQVHVGREEVSLDVRMGSGSYWTVPFRADRRADALAHAEELAKSRGLRLKVTSDTLVAPDPDLLVRDQAMILAEAVVRNTGSVANYVALGVRNRGSSEAWPSDLEDAVARFCEATKAPCGGRDLAWAAEVFKSFGAMLELEREAGLSASKFVSEITKGGMLPYEYWASRERDRRPDVAALVEPDFDAVAMGM